MVYIGVVSFYCDNNKTQCQSLHQHEERLKGLFEKIHKVNFNRA